MKEELLLLISNFSSFFSHFLSFIDNFFKIEKKKIIRRGGTEKYFSTLSDLYHYYDLFSTRKYVG